MNQKLDKDTIRTITHNEYYKPGYKSKDLNMRYECPSGLVFYVYYSYNDVLCFCVEKSKKNHVFKDAVKQLLDTDENYGHDEYNYIYKYFDVSSDEEICFSDFSMPGTYNLINPEYRNKIICKMVDEIVRVFRSVGVWDQQ